jgi:hypothetical protein
MANKQKAAGTAEETRLVRNADRYGLPARRAENNRPSRDVDLQADVLTVVEVKHRANLNVHAVLRATLKLYPQHRCAVVWHRLSRKGDNVKRTSDGPTIMALPVSDALALLSVARHAAEHVAQPGDETLARLSAALQVADPATRP